MPETDLRNPDDETGDGRDAGRLGVIGGSGLYEIDGLESPEWRRVESPWGEVSGDILTGTLEGCPVAFLSRHGKGHRIPPSDINYRANIDALKRCNVREVVSVSACGSLREAAAPGHFVIIDQFFDRTRTRPGSFFGEGCVAHVSLAHPICSRLAADLATATETAGVPTHRGGTYLAMEGPQFSTFAESRFYRKTLGCDVIGMTNMPEARLAREAEICYATLAMVTDYDCWHPDHGEVDIPSLLAVMRDNVENACASLRLLARTRTDRRPDCVAGCERALEYAVITRPESRDPALVRKLDAIAGRVLAG